MKCKIDKLKLSIENIFKENNADSIDIYLLCNIIGKNIESIFQKLIEMLNNLNDNIDDDYINKIIISITSYIELCNEEKLEFNESDKKSLLSIEDIYNDYLNNYNKEPSSTIFESITKLKETLENNKISEYEKKLIIENDDLSRLVEDLESKLIALNTKVKLYEDKIVKLETKNKKIENDNQDILKKIKDLKEKYQILKEKYDKFLLEKEALEQVNVKNNNDFYILEIELEKIKIINKELDEKVNKLELELTEATNRLNEYELLKEQNNKKNELDNIVLKKLFKGEFTIFNLYTQLNDEGYNYTKDEISESLKRIKEKICIIDSQKKSIPIIYKVSSPIYSQNNVLEINNIITNSIDLLITSDWHLSTFIDISKTLSIVDSLYNYCIANNISKIINLGDFLDVKLVGNRYEQYSNNMRLLESILELFPKDKNIVQAIMGGNHDMRMLNLGIDPLKYLEDNRSDFINLGYNNASISFMNDQIEEIIGLHHPGSLNYGLEVPEMQEFVSAYLKNVYKDNDISKKDVYMDLFGHYHKNIIDGANHYALVPALMKMNGKSPNGAYHFEVYFNEDNTINYILIKSIMPDRMHEPISEYVYQKKKN